ncbi:exo-alpha-sialidase [Luteococcus sp. OSA5]|uniref:exo-alpha-sialidase n=1 Tax=Luteococcus sp. OSA5 TaxID=3401630 RepID=UPI003B438B2E
MFRLPPRPARLTVAALGLALLALPLAPAGAAPSGKAHSPFAGDDPFYREQMVAVHGEQGFPNYRIPALTVAPSGDVLVSYDGRPTGIDAPGPNSILQRRSTDGGRNFEAMSVIRQGKVEAPKEGFSDPSYIVDEESGDIFNFHVHSFDAGLAASRPGVDPDDRNVLHAEVSVSKDDGATWEHRTITADITPDLSVRSRFAASGQGIQLKYGPHKGRLLQQFTIVTATGDFRAVSIYSDDHGKTWHSGKPVGTRMDENKTVELSDGRVMLNSRDSARSGYRKVAYSSNGGITYGPVTLEKQLPDPANNASIIRAFPDAPKGSGLAKVLLFSNSASATERAHGTIRASCDDGRTWPIAREFKADSMSYSTLAALPDGTFGLAYEPANGIAYANFNLDWLRGQCAPVQLPEAAVERGQTHDTRLTITNQEGRALVVKDVAVTLPAGWVLDGLDRDTVAVPPGQGRSLPVSLSVPAQTRGGVYEIPVTVTGRDGRTSQFTWRVSVPKTADELDGRIEVSQATHTNPQSSYAVGDVLRFSYTVRNLTNASTTVVPSGNLRGLDPAVDARNCRYTNLKGKGSYTCTSAHHVLTQEDLAAGAFTPEVTWVSTSGADVTTVVTKAPTVSLG